ncbi:hypothetical protein D9M73_143310 [compost metagenome]
MLADAGGGDEFFLHETGGIDRRRFKRAVSGVIGRVAAPASFRLLEIGQDLGERPAFTAELAPFIIVDWVTARVNLAVYRGGTTEKIALRQIDPPVVELGLRLRLKLPVQIRRIVAVETDAHVKYRVPVGSARFKQKNLPIGIFREAGCHDAACRARTNDDIIDFLHAPAP